MLRGPIDFLPIINLPKDDVQNQLDGLFKDFLIPDRVKTRREKLDCLRKLYFMSAYFPIHDILKKDYLRNKFALSDEFIQFILFEMGYKPVNNTKKTPYNYTLHKKDKIHLVRLEALLSISATRFFPLSTLPINNYQAPSLMNLLTKEKDGNWWWGEVSELNRRLLWQPEDGYYSDEILNNLVIALENDTVTPFTTVPAILQRENFTKTRNQIKVITIGIDDVNSQNAINRVEKVMIHALSQASTLSDFDPAKKRIIKKNPTPVIELDGSITKESFTILCIPTNEFYSPSQRLNIVTFSILYQWLDKLYNRQTVYNDHVQEGTNGLLISIQFRDVISNYCQRVIEQSKLVPQQDSTIFGKGAWSNNQLAEQGLIYAIRILRLLCKIDNQLVPSLFALMKSICNRSSIRVHTGISIELLRFFIDHSEVMMYDPDPIFNIFFQYCLPKNHNKALTAFETLTFCNEYKEKLLNQTSIFSKYFPPILKLFCWYPFTHFNDINDLLPALISSSNCIEIFHNLLDLPLIAVAMEKTDENAGAAAIEDLSNEIRVLYNYLLRNESGVSINFWENASTLPLLQEFCKSSIVTPRVRAVASHVPQLLETYFDVLIANANSQILQDILPMIFQRLDQLYPLPSYQQSVNKILVDKVLAIFHMYPSFIVSKKALIIETLTSSIPGRAELIIALCWIIGEYANTNLVSSCTDPIIKEYHEKLEYFSYERISIVKNNITNIAHLSTTPPPSFAPFDPIFNETAVRKETTRKTSSQLREYTTRLMLIIISSFAKLAARCPELSSQVTLNLQKILLDCSHFDELVVQRATECMTILKYPSIASAVLNSSQHDNDIHNIRSHISDHTSLPFLLQSTNEIVHPFSDKQKLHKFEL